MLRYLTSRKSFGFIRASVAIFIVVIVAMYEALSSD